MRQSTKNEGITRTYHFWARPLGGIPSELWQAALDSQRFWNELVALRENVAFNSQTRLASRNPESPRAERLRRSDGGKAVCNMQTLHTQPKTAENFVQFVDSTDQCANLRTFIRAILVKISNWLSEHG
jgi:hypothetical protein